MATPKKTKNPTPKGPPKTICLSHSPAGKAKSQVRRRFFQVGLL